ncbi:rRNA maturation RNase YbeY [uncultured Thermanaerothrix sp.]|uniref:rRNA maturation RNase YbeY n=1 Tax=uncultured Thermanaerothrix sp. TaxID=1195149 RepID=UPI00263885F0|nr:rRNA maturation RNase YbeY [uncultured Thermanaerothrix sp.]
MINLIVEPPFEKQVNQDLVIRAAEAVLKFEQRDVDLSIVVSDNNELQRLNYEFLGYDAPTDVLSFPSGEVDPETQRLYAGDIIISWEKVNEQAQKSGHSPACELTLLVVHGILHLLGYDHTTEDEKQVMWRLQAEILQSLGCDPKILPD